MPRGQCIDTPVRTGPDVHVVKDSGTKWVVGASPDRENAVIDAIRSERSRKVREERAGRRGLAVIDIDDALTRRSDLEAVRRAMDALTDDERAGITLAYFAGHSYREVAVMLGQPEGTVKSRIRQGLHRMQRALRAEFIAALTVIRCS